METTLYERLGGRPAIDTLVDRIVDAHLANPKVAARYEHADVARAREMAKQFFAAGTGGPDPYSGRSMVETHSGMNISEEEYVAVVDDILGAMDDLGYGQVERDEVLAIAWSLKPEIVRI